MYWAVLKYLDIFWKTPDNNFYFIYNNFGYNEIMFYMRIINTTFCGFAFVTRNKC